MAFCFECGTDIGTDKFCSKCGKSSGDINPDIKKEVFFMSSKCESCDIETKNTKFCDKCVKKTIERTWDSNKTVEPKEKIRLSTISKNVSIITFIISFQFILGFIAAAYFFSKIPFK